MSTRVGRQCRVPERTRAILRLAVVPAALFAAASLNPLRAVPIQWSPGAGGNGNFYEFIDVGSFLSWTEADALATGAGGHLATITSSAENDFVMGLTGGVEAYIGLTDRNAEGTFEWITGEPFSYSNWAAGEPNDHMAPASPLGEDFVVINPPGIPGGPGLPPGLWNDVPDNSFRITAYVVETQITNPEPSSVVLLIGGALLGLALRRRARGRER